MTRLDNLRQAVKELYEERREDRAAWCDWLYEQHLFTVAANAKRLAIKYGADAELTEAAALLHDIADTRLLRFDPRHEEETLRIARKLMAEAGYEDREIAIVVDDAVRLHGCHDGERPATREGLVLATADSLAHLQTDYYVWATMALGREKTTAEAKDWVLKKIERDLNAKISFDDEREDARGSYNLIKELFSR